RERGARPLEECAARLGQQDASLRAREQPDSDLVFQGTDLPAERWLRDRQSARRAAEAQLLRNGDVVSKVAQLHRASALSRLPGRRPIPASDRFSTRKVSGQLAQDTASRVRVRVREAAVTTAVTARAASTKRV